MTTLNIEEIKKILPQQNETLFVDFVSDLKPKKEIDAKKNVAANENYFQGHFPEFPIVPGVILVEALKQVASILILKSIDADPHARVILNSVKNVKFRHMVRPGDTLLMHCELKNEEDGKFTVSAVGMDDGEKAVSAKMELSVTD